MRQAEAALALRSRPFTAEELRGSRAQVDQARATLSAAQAQQREATVRAPGMGWWPSAWPRPGPRSGPQAPLLTLVSDAVEVALQVEEMDVARVVPGNPVTLTVGAFRGEFPFAGRVASISPTGDPRQRPSPCASARTTTACAKPGMFVQGTLRPRRAERLVNPVEHADAWRAPTPRTPSSSSARTTGRELRPVQLGLLLERPGRAWRGPAVGEAVVVEWAGACATAGP